MRVAIIIAAVTVALVAWYLRRDDGAPDTARPAATAAHPTPAFAPTPPALPALAPATAAVDPPASDDPLALVDATHAAVHAIGRRCFAERTPRAAAPNTPDDTVGRLELRLRVAVAGGTARVASAEVESTRHLRDDVRDCIVEGARAASWPVTAPDGTHEIVELFRMGDYVAVPSPDSPPPAPPRR